jgi:hypothetical protein
MMGGLTVFGEQPKTCTECGVTKPAGSFYVCPGMRDGRMNRCRECASKAQRLYREREKTGEKSLLRQPATCSRGEIEEETFETRRDQYIVLLAAAARRWCAGEDKEERDGAREALIFRCRQLIEAEGLVST